MTRVPYADRPEVVAEFCTCPQDDEGVREVWHVKHADGTLSGFYIPDPKCPLHGDNVQPSPF
jgi:hypothetical protein